MCTLGTIADIVGIAGAIFALLAWINTQLFKKRQKRERERMNHSIKVVLSHGDKTFELPVAVSRKDVTRDEIMGRLGMIPRRGKSQDRFKIRSLNTKYFLDQINSIYNGNSDQTLMISCSKEEFNQFDLDAYLEKV